MRRIARGWLLWLALLLPIAQAMAGVHALSHATGERLGDSIGHLVHCDLCLTAADLGTGAPAAEPAAPAAGVALHAAPLVAHAAARQATRLGLPPARAPPASV